jgi:hypothetical protein
VKALVILWNVVAGFALLLVLVVASSRYLERPRSSFATYAEAEAAGMFKAGWLPSYLPKSATNIEERHDIDTNNVWASFSYAPEDTKTIQDNCRLQTQSPEGAKYLCPPFEKQTLVVILRNNGTGWLESHANEI